MTRHPSMLSAAAAAAAICILLLLLPSGPASSDHPPGTTAAPPTPSSADASSGPGAADLDALDAGGLQPGLTRALARARATAADAGVELPVNSGYRSVQEQAALLAAEIAKRGDTEEARRWVFPPDRSMHVRGLAVDISHGPGANWLNAHGHRYGLCRTLAWEWWHFEWRQAWEDEERCPAPARDLSDVPTS